MGRILIRHVAVLYVSLLVFCTVTFYISVNQSQDRNTFESTRRHFEDVVKMVPKINGDSSESDHHEAEKDARDQGDLAVQDSLDQEDTEFWENNVSVEKYENQADVFDPEDDVNEVKDGQNNDRKDERHWAREPNSFRDQRSSNSSAVFRPFPAVFKPMLPAPIALNCTKVWRGDTKEIKRILHQLNDTQPARRPPGFYREITKNCKEYRRENGFIEKVSKEEESFPLAFTLLVYKEPEQVERLIRTIYRPHNVYCVHIDLKTKPSVLQDIRAIIQCFPNVVEAPKQVSVVWGKFSVLEPELLCMEKLWRMLTKWKYLINLTGQELPLRTNWELVKIFQVYNGSNDILGELPKDRNKWRWEQANKPPPHNISIAKGPVHIAASRGYIDFLLHSTRARDFLEWTKLTGIPDETFFATVNNLHQFRVPGSYTGNLTSRRRIMLNRFKIWDMSGRSCGGEFLRHICQFGPADVATLTQSRHLVANKFSYELYPLAYDCTEQWYFDRVRAESARGGVDPKLPLQYYGQLEIVQHAYRGANGSWRDMT